MLRIHYPLLFFQMNLFLVEIKAEPTFVFAQPYFLLPSHVKNLLNNTYLHCLHKFS